MILICSGSWELYHGILLIANIWLLFWQERRSFLFCQEDRAILCRECDISIHRANEHTQKHNRFLLTGVKLSASTSLYNNQTSSTSTTSTDLRTQPPSTATTKRSRTVSNEISSSASVEINPMPSNTDNASYSTSSISEYLMETLPGWQVEDFLDPSFASNGFCKVCSTHFTLLTKQERFFIFFFFLLGYFCLTPLVFHNIKSIYEKKNWRWQI